MSYLTKPETVLAHVLAEQSYTFVTSRTCRYLYSVRRHALIWSVAVWGTQKWDYLGYVEQPEPAKPRSLFYTHGKRSRLPHGNPPEVLFRHILTCTRKGEMPVDIVLRKERDPEVLFEPYT